MCEQSIIGARASVMVYDDIQKKWVPSGSSSGLSKVQIYHHQQNNTFRVVGRKLQDHEVVINCSIVKGLKYNQATTTFHQWRDSKYVYGLNFSSQQDAEAFSRAMLHALDVLSGRFTQQMVNPIVNNAVYEEDMGYRTMTREDAAIIQQQQIISTTVSSDTPTTPNSHSNAANMQSQTPPQGHHRTSSAPPAPQPPPIPPGLVTANTMHIHQQYHSTTVAASTAGQPIEKHYGHQPIYMPQQSVVQNQQNQIPFSQPNIPTNVSQNIDPQPPHSSGPIYISASQMQPSINNNNVFVNQQQQQQHQQQATPPPQAFITSVTSGTNTNNYINQPPTAPPLPPAISCTTAIVAPPVPPQMIGLAPPPPPPQLHAITSGNAGGSVVRNGPPPPPPLPPIGMLANKMDGMDMSSLAAQLQQAKLKRSTKNSPSNPSPFENSGSSTSSGGSASGSTGGGGYGTIGRPKMASMMDEMAKTLARRRAQADKNESDATEDNNCRRLNNEKANTLPHKISSTASANSSSNSSGTTNMTANSSDSPRLLRKRFGSISDDTIFKQIGDGEGGVVLTNNQELINFKAEIIREIQIEINKAKQDIIDALKIELHRS